MPQLALLLCFMLACGLTPSHAQDTSFYDGNGTRVYTLDACTHYAVSAPDTAAPERTLTVIRTREGRIKSETRMLNQGSPSSTWDGISRYYYPDGALRSEREFDHNKNVRVDCFWPGGQPRRIDRYENDSLVSGQCFKEDGSLDTYTPYEIQPEFKGGMENMYKYMKRNIRYPKKAAGAAGKVYVQFTIDKDGAIINPSVIRSVHPLLDAEALRVVSEMPPWTPGSMDGEPVKCKFRLPVSFQ